jgi:hypothetical protein
MPYTPLEEDKRAQKEMETGLKMVVNMSIDAYESCGANEVEKKTKPCIWGLMENAGIEVVEKPEEKRGWRV